MTLIQLQDADEIWSLEDEHGLYLHYVADADVPRGRTVIPITRIVLERMAERVREAPIADERQNVIPFPRAA